MLVFQSKGTAQVDPWQLHVLLQERPRHTLPLVYWEEKEDKIKLPQAFFQIQVPQDLCPLSEDPLPASPLLGLDRLCAISDACLANQDQMLNLDLDLMRASWIYLYDPYDEFSDVAILSLPLPEKTFTSSKQVTKDNDRRDNDKKANDGMANDTESGLQEKEDGAPDEKDYASDIVSSTTDRNLIDEICDRYFLGDRLRMVLQNYFQEKNFSKLRSEVELAKTHLPHPDQIERRERLEAQLRVQNLASPEKKKKWLLERQKVQEAMVDLEDHPGGIWAQPERQPDSLWQKVKYLFGGKAPIDQALANKVAEAAADYNFEGEENSSGLMDAGNEKGLSGLWGVWGQRQARRQLQRQILQNQSKEKTLPLPDHVESNSFAVISEGLPGSGREKEGLRAFILTSEFIIGRDAALCDFVLPTKAVGRRHARISKFGEDYFIQDLGSVNGTLLDGKRLNRHELYLLPDRCQLRFADMAFHFSRDLF